MIDKKPKRPRDPSQLAKLIVDISTGTEDDRVEPDKKNLAAVALGRLGGKKGGSARAKKLSPARRREIARAAAKKRWENRSRD